MAIQHLILPDHWFPTSKSMISPCKQRFSSSSSSSSSNSLINLQFWIWDYIYGTTCPMILSWVICLNNSAIYFITEQVSCSFKSQKQSATDETRPQFWWLARSAARHTVYHTCDTQVTFTAAKLIITSSCRKLRRKCKICAEFAQKLRWKWAKITCKLHAICTSCAQIERKNPLKIRKNCPKVARKCFVVL